MKNKILAAAIFVFISVCGMAQGPPPPPPPPPGYEGAPQFPGGLEAFQKYLQDSIRYPLIEKEAGISGTVYVSFIVEKDGAISNVKAKKEVAGGPGLTAEAIRVIKAMPNWIPASVNGTKVRVEMTQPIKFWLEDPQPTSPPVFTDPHDSSNPPLQEMQETTVGKTDSTKIAAAKSYHESDSGVVYTFVEEMPQFPGGSDSLKKFLVSNIKYPSHQHAQGTIYMQFVVEKDGSVSNIKALKEIAAAPAFTKEAMRVIALMPKWTPGKDHGKTERVRMILPIRFGFY